MTVRRSTEHWATTARPGPKRDLLCGALLDAIAARVPSPTHQWAVRPVEDREVASIEAIEVDNRGWFSRTESLHRRPLGLDARDGYQGGDDGHGKQALSHARRRRKGHTVEMDWEGFTCPA